jgi:NAD+ kinase
VRRLALVVHPTRDVSSAMNALVRWSEAQGIAVVRLAEAEAEPAPGDLVVALGGDGTVLRALRAAATVDAPVLGVACGSLGALSAVPADDLAGALDRVRAGDWVRRSLPALSIASPAIPPDWAVNDFVVARGGPSQLAADVSVDGELYVRLAGDGVVVATPLGSSAYTMAAGGPILAAGAPAFVCTPVAMHGGSAPPLVVPAASTLDVEIHPGYGGYALEVDGIRRPADGLRFRFTLEPDKLVLVAFAEPGHGLTALRHRGLIADSPRILARDQRSGSAPG